MPNITANLGYELPLGNETADIEVLNKNFTKIDGDIVTKLQEAKDYIDNTVKDYGKNTEDAIRDLKLNTVAISIELETLKGATLTGVDANIFVETFVNIDEIESLNDALKFDEIYHKVYLL